MANQRVPNEPTAEGFYFCRQGDPKEQASYALVKKPYATNDAAWRELESLRKALRCKRDYFQVVRVVIVDGSDPLRVDGQGSYVLMASLACATREGVIDAMREHDTLGRDTFLSRYGFRPSTGWQLRHRGRSYPSKAILGVAAHLLPREFFGGVAQVVPALQRLGFEMRRGKRVLADGEIASLSRAIGFEDVQAPMALSPTCYFASGSNQPGEIRGLATVGHDVGTCAPHLSANGISELRNLAGTDVQVFVDSGAFSEVEFGPDGPKVVRPISHTMWLSVFAIYRRLADVLGTQLWVVAPDMIGNQEESLARLEKYADQLVDLSRDGVRILVPIQLGTVSQYEFAQRVDSLLKRYKVEWYPALPCKKSATTPQQAEDFVARFQPKHVHLLGVGPRNRLVKDYVAACRGRSYSLDSNWITANVGRQGKVRRYTAARDVARNHIEGPGRVAELALVCALGLLV